jgi:hypothetical protein
VVQHLYEKGGLAMCKTERGYAVYHVQSGRDLTAPFREQGQAYDYLHAVLPLLDWRRPHHQGFPWESKRPMAELAEQARRQTCPQ